jgi:hypothetical protein
MALLRDLLLWFLIAGHVVGGAVAFRRFFPRESPWFGFVVPPLALVMLLNFVEHCVALPSLLWLLPVTTLGLIWLIARGGFSWEGMQVPLAAFLLAFAFTFGVRCANPNITTGSDGMYDLALVLDYCHGEKIPPTDSWLPTLDLKLYYSFQQYAASVVKRLFNVDVGTACNASHALLSAFTAFCGAAVAFRASGGRGWVALTVVFLIEAAFTGSSAYLKLFLPDRATYFVANNLGGSLDNPDRTNNPIWYWVGLWSHHQRLELQVSGYWTWRDEYHANSSGHFLTLFSVFSVLELLRRERANFPWICAVLIVPLVMISSMWLAPVDGILCAGGLALALLFRRQPVSWWFAGYGVAAGVVALWPTLGDLLTAQQVATTAWTNMWTAPEMRTPPFEWLIQWWPVYLPWIATLCFWRQLPLGVRWICIAVPIFLIGIEVITFDDDRYNTMEKIWGCIYGTGLVTFFGVVAARRNVACRLITGLIIACATVSMFGWLHQLSKRDTWNLQGDGWVRSDTQKREILETMQQLHGATFLAGHADYNYTEAPAVTVFTGNRCYVASTFGESRFGHGMLADARALLNNDFYSGTMAEPLAFLDANAIAGVIIWPGDKIPDALVASLKTKLAPTYLYQDCRENGDANAGVFLRQPLPVVRR